MIKILKKSALQGADKYGECTACGRTKDDSGIEIYKIEFESVYGKKSSLNICRDCAIILSDMIDGDVED